LELRGFSHLWIAEQMLADGNEKESQEEFRQAKESLEAAGQTAGPDPLREECMGYCDQRRSQFTLATVSYSKALQLGLDTAELRNNLGLISLKNKKFVVAREHLDMAIEISPELQAPWFNRATLEFQESFQKRRAVRSQGVSDIETAVVKGPGSVDLHLTAASIHARTPTPNVEAVVRHLQRAVACGLNLRSFKVNEVAQFATDQNRAAFLQALVKDPGFRKLQTMKPSGVVRQKIDGILRPTSVGQRNAARVFRSH